MKGGAAGLAYLNEDTDLHGRGLDLAFVLEPAPWYVNVCVYSIRGTAQSGYDIMRDEFQKDSHFERGRFQNRADS